MTAEDGEDSREERSERSRADGEPQALECEEHCFCVDGLSDEWNHQEEAFADEELAGLLQLCEDAYVADIRLATLSQRSFKAPLETSPNIAVQALCNAGLSHGLTYSDSEGYCN